jgi:hypothetical protein
MLFERPNAVLQRPAPARRAARGPDAHRQRLRHQDPLGPAPRRRAVVGAVDADGAEPGRTTARRLHQPLRLQRRGPGGRARPVRRGPHPPGLRSPEHPQGAVRPDALYREIATDNEAANWTASLLRNGAVPGVIISPEGDTSASAATSKTSRRSSSASAATSAAQPLVMKGPTKVQVLSFTPEQMNLRADAPDPRGAHHGRASASRRPWSGSAPGSNDQGRRDDGARCASRRTSRA